MQGLIEDSAYTNQTRESRRIVVVRGVSLWMLTAIRSTTHTHTLSLCWCARSFRHEFFFFALKTELQAFAHLRANAIEYGLVSWHATFSWISRL